VFRLESAFGIKIPENEIWRGSIDPADVDNPQAVAAAVERLKARMPAFRWSALPARLSRADLPRLITVQTIVEYLERRV
jgi:acyl carrier protein